MTVSTINPQISRIKAVVILAIIAVILMCALFAVPKDGGAIKELSNDYNTFTFGSDGTFTVEDPVLETSITFTADGQKGVEDDSGNYYPVVDGCVTLPIDDHGLPTDGTVTTTYDIEVNRFYTTVWALIPAIVAITLALITKEVYSSLFVGILMGAVLWADFSGILTINHVVDDGFVGVLADSWNSGILVFLVVLGVIGVLVLKSGGTRAYGEWALKHIKSRKMAQLSTFFLGVLIFVDDYFNCLTVGSIMRPLTDKFKVSRAKLAYLIDSTAAPICIIAPVSSWAAAVTSNLGEDVYGHNTMEIFIECIPYNLYAILTIVMVITVCLLGFDFGPMRKHEENAINTGDLFSTDYRPYENSVEEKINDKGHILDLVLPIFLFLIPSCILSLVYTGGFFDGETFVQAFADADAARGLAMGSIIGLLLTIIYLVIRKASTFHDLMDSLPKGFRNMVPAILILIFAWSLTTMTKALGSSAFVADVLSDSGNLESFLPAIFMLVACFIAFSTGTSWGTMGILLPIVVSVFPDNYDLLIIAISACMAGAVFGDHCSPISDTTIMSSAGAQCSHVIHVSTQAPYALVVAGTAFVFYLILGFVHSWIVTIVACAAMVGVIFAIRYLSIMLENKKGSGPETA